MRVVLKTLGNSEKLQERALRFVYLDKVSSYDDLLTKANLTTLHLGRLKMLATEVYKSVHKLNPPPIYSGYLQNQNHGNESTATETKQSSHTQSQFNNLWTQLVSLPRCKNLEWLNPGFAECHQLKLL